MKMIVYAINVAAVLAAFAAGLGIAYADDHSKKTSEHLEEAIRSGKEGSTQGVVSHTEEAKKELIEQNKEHPYTHLQKPIYGEHEKAEHDREVFEEMDLAIDEAKEGHSQQAVEALERASDHLREKEHAK
ncbi:small metal-binding protein SmbP [Nitrosospira sp. Nsp2]|jgi:hydrogenase maturation factor HypE|uniref:small metal-binding protein SmbP n=1 Tax=Nitrosospira sp. Nsp2 TaxID=136548 RepID=UPI000D2F7B65|nr:small metal-binding protein SmbP [Nitrosospira sp. Nsp2]